ncbi:hypothetical protein BTJ40_04165 [Microbulbifer sp. A4B17]|uniref:hypothetical protein n=1 Tax=Microbulbifer sp. A4B17 TaxID=359370 RepID=UPI000D52E205|nr:hypothetical protein [Microbulbifer sp. A4B17]AWF80076.1 hypothetical protein BTJ40_04165 [Microbulbifer sp. A4B17]
MVVVLDKFLSMPTPWRVVLSAIMGFLAGPALIGVFSEYAAYWYALEMHVRPPVEGIPYLSATVTFTSFIIVVMVSAVFLLTRMVVGYFIGNVVLSIEIYPKLLSKFFVTLTGRLRSEINIAAIEGFFAAGSEGVKEFEKLPAKKAIYISLLFAVISSSLITLIIWMVNDESEVFKILIIFSLYVFFVLLSLWRRFVMILISFVTAIAFYFFTISLLFNGEQYSKFLRVTGFGGELPVSIEVNDRDKPIGMTLVLRSRDWLIGYEVGSQRVIEVPISSVRNIQYLSDSKSKELTRP